MGASLEQAPPAEHPEEHPEHPEHQELAEEEPNPPEAANSTEAVEEAGWGFHIPSMASFMPSFSFSLVRSTHLGFGPSVDQLQELFPHISRAALEAELRVSGSVDFTVERILGGVANVL